MSAPARLFLCCAAVLVWAAGPAWAGPEAARPDPAPDTTAAAAEGPRWHCDQGTVDLGPLFEGEARSLSFVLSNPGTAPLEVRAVKPACGCTQTGTYDRRIAPGKSGTLTFKFDTRHMHGAVRRAIRVETNAVDRPSALLYIQAQVSPAFEVVPPRVEFGVLDPTRPSSPLRVRIRNRRPELVRFLPPTDSGIFRTEWRVLEPGREFELAVTIADDPDGGTHSGRLRLLPEGSDAFPILIPVSAYVPAAVDVRPKAIVLAAQPLTGPMERVVSVHYTRAGEIELTDLNTGSTDVTARLLDPVRGKHFRILVRFPAGYRPGPAGAALTFTTSDPDFPRISVPLLQEPALTPVTTGGRP